MMSLSRKPKVIACIPAFNEEKTIAKVVLLAQRHVDKVVVCDDGSKDMTAEIAERLGADVVRHKRNLGYGTAIRMLFGRARELGADVVVTLDADLQHDPGEIPVLVGPVLSGEADVVVGSRFMGKGVGAPGYRVAGVRVITGFAERVSDLGLSDAQCGFRAYSRRAFTAITPSEMGMGVSTEILVKAADLGLRVVEVPVSVKYRGLERTSTRSPLYHGLDVIGSMLKHLSIRHPLLFYGLPALFSIFVALFFGIWTFQIYVAVRQLNVSLALITMASTIVGLILGTTAIMLYTLVSVLRERK